MASVTYSPALAARNGLARPATRPAGQSGTANFGGVIRVREMVPEFRGKTLFRTVDRMVRSDPVVRAAILMVVLPLREAEWVVSPAGTTDEDREAAELVRRALFEHNDWPQVIWDLASSGVKYGRGVVEETYGAVDWSLTYEVDDETVEVPQRTYWVPRRYGSRLAETIDRWHVDDEGDLERITQQLPTNQAGESTRVDIPASQLVVWVNEKDGDNYEGTSMVRAMYRNWYAKEKLEIIDAIRAERAGVGVPVGWAGDGSVEDLEDALRDLRVNEEGYIVLAGSPPGADGHNQSVEMLDMKAASTADVAASLHYHTTQILWGVLGAWQQLGQGNVGARATSETQDDPFYLLVSSVAKSLASAFSRQSIPRLIGYNFAALDRAPKLTVGALPGADFTSMIDSLAKAMTAGAIETDLELENWIRRKIGAPERKPDDDQDEEPEVEEPPTATPPAPGQEPGDGQEPDDPMQQDGPNSEDTPGAVEEDDQGDAPPALAQGGLLRRAARAVRWFANLDTSHVLSAAQAKPDGVTTRMADGTEFTAWRALTPLETHVLFQATDTTIEQMRDEYVRAATPEMERLAAFAAGAAAGGRAVEPDMLARAEEALAERLAEVLTRTAAFGRVAVRSEITSQRGTTRPRGLSVSDAVAALAKEPPKDPEKLDGWIVRISRKNAKAITTRVTLAAEQAGGRLGDMPQEALAERARKAGEGALRAEAVQTVAHALAAGRRAEAAEAVDRGESAGFATYSAVLDARTCGPCMSLDGQVYEVGSPEYERDYPPLYACQGGDACRCVMVVEALGPAEVLPEEQIDPTAH